MEMRSEIDAVEQPVDEAVSAAPMRPTRPGRPSRPDGAKRSARPMLLTTPVEAPDVAAVPQDGEIKEVVLAKPERPARPLAADRPARAERPKVERRARVLEPDQVAASRGEDYDPPSSEARDAMLGADDAPATSKVGAVFQSFGQIVAGLKKSKTEDKAVEDVAEPMATEADGHEDVPKSSKIAGVLTAIKLPKKAKKAEEGAEQQDMVSEDDAPKAGGIMAVLGKFKKAKAEPVEKETLSLEESFEAQIEPAVAFDDMPEMDPAHMPAKPSMMARFDTPLMGVVAGLAVSFVGLIGASVLFG